MAGAVGSIEDDPGIAVFQADAFGFVFQVVEVPGDDDAFVLEVDQVEQKVVGRVAVREEGVAAADDAALPDVDAGVEPGDVEHVGVGQVHLAVRIGIGQARQAELLEQFVVAVAAAVGVDESVFGVEAPVDGAGVVGARVEDLLDDAAALQRDIGHVAAVFTAAGGDIQQRELRAARGFLYAETGVVAV